MIQGKKAQVTLFIIVALIVASVSGVVISVNKSTAQAEVERSFASANAPPVSFLPVQEYIETCTGLVFDEALMLFGKQGGIIYPDQGGLEYYDDLRLETGDYSGHKILYRVLNYSDPDDPTQSVPWNLPAYPCQRFKFNNPYCDMPETYSGRSLYGSINRFYSSTDPSQPEQASAGIERYIEQKIFTCIDLDKLKQTYDLSLRDDVRAEVSLAPNYYEGEDFSRVSLKLHLPLSLATANDAEFTVTDLFVQRNIRLPTMYKLAEYIVENEIHLSSDPEKDIPRTVGYDQKVSIIRDVGGTFDDLYVISDDTSKLGTENYTFEFLVKNRPPVLGFIGKSSDPYSLNDQGMMLVPQKNLDGTSHEFVLQLAAKDPDGDAIRYDVEVNLANSDSDRVGDFLAAFHPDAKGKIAFTASEDMVGAYDVTMKACDNQYCDSQNFRFVLDDAPEFDLFGKNGYYYHPDLDFSAFTISAGSTTISAGSTDKGGSVANLDTFVREVVADDAHFPRGRMLYVPCVFEDGTGDSLKAAENEWYRTTIGEIKNRFSAGGGYTYRWHYKCNDHDWTELSCDTKICYANFGTCTDASPQNTITIKATVFDGYSTGFSTLKVPYDRCLACRPCCEGGTPLDRDRFCEFNRFNNPLGGVISDSYLETVMVCRQDVKGIDLSYDASVALEKESGGSLKDRYDFSDYFRSRFANSAFEASCNPVSFKSVKYQPIRLTLPVKGGGTNTGLLYPRPMCFDPELTSLCDPRYIRFSSGLEELQQKTGYEFRPD